MASTIIAATAGFTEKSCGRLFIYPAGLMGVREVAGVVGSRPVTAGACPVVVAVTVRNCRMCVLRLRTHIARQWMYVRSLRIELQTIFAETVWLYGQSRT